MLLFFLFLSCTVDVHVDAACVTHGAVKVGLVLTLPSDDSPAGKASRSSSQCHKEAEVILFFLQLMRCCSWRTTHLNEPLIPFTDDFVEYIFKNTRGEPRDIITQCGRVLDTGIAQRIPKLTKKFAQEVLEQNFE